MKRLILVILAIFVFVSCTPAAPSADMSGYEGFTDTENVFIQTEMDDVLKMLDEGGSGIVYFGFPRCPWCTDALPILNEEAKKVNKRILYVQTRDMEKNLLYTEEQKQRFISHASSLMRKDDDGNYQLYVPFVIVIKKGEIIEDYIGSGDYSADEEISPEQQEELHKIYAEMLK